MHLQLPKAAHSSSRALVALVALSGAKVEIADADVKEPVLKANGADVTGPVAIARAIIGAGKNQSVNGPADQQESISSWLAYAASFPKENVDADLKKLDDSLRLATFLVGAAPSIADVFVYSAIFATIESFNNVQRFAFANATRWFDHVQHLPALNAHRNRLSLVTIKRNVASILAEKAAIEKGKPAERQHKPAAEAKPEDKPAAPAAAAAAPAAAAPAEAKGKKEKPAAKGQGDQKAAGKGKAAGKAEAASTQSDISRLEIKVGKIIEVKQHTENLYVEKIDLGEAAPRTIVSGLVKFVPLDQMQNRFVLVLANLQPRALQGITSEGMVLAASDDAHTTVQLLDVPAGVAPGERVTFPGEAGEAEKPHLNKKVLDRVFPDLKTNADCVATYKGLAFTTSKGPVKVASLKDAHIK